MKIENRDHTTSSLSYKTVKAFNRREWWTLALGSSRDENIIVANFAPCKYKSDKRQKKIITGLIQATIPVKMLSDIILTS